ncbi:hypothetical protein EMPG_09665 [Blastomyces silverae]|uniref:Uncharacterized protein n=1 Tax=Blastomyces silverae TaxID=2060906 RepID=A0A0H1BKA9_9EURO|nr:hypothetical protein EMPG_09665 [Blastomyces silverae]
MKSIISLPILLSLALSISAAPLEQSILINPGNDGLRLRPMEEAMISTLSNAGIYLCDRAGFAGHCVHYATPFGQCSKLLHSGLSKYQQSMSLKSLILNPQHTVTIIDQFPRGKGVKSARSDRGSWCTLYSQPECHGDELQVHHPGYPDLRHQDWGDRAHSYNCRPAE